MMTKRLDIPTPPIAIPQSSPSPIPTSSSPFHQQRLSTATLSPTTSMAQLSTNSPPVDSHQQDRLKNRLSEILNEQRMLQQRKEELARMVNKFLSVCLSYLFSNYYSIYTDETTNNRLLTV